MERPDMDEDAPLLNGRREPKAPMPMKGRVIPDPPPRPPIPEIQLTRDMPQSDPTKDFAEFAEAQAKKVTLGKQPKVAFFIGRGRTGKTTNIRFLISEMDSENLNFGIIDADASNAVLHQYTQAAALPPDYELDELVNWLGLKIANAVARSMHVLVDLGGGDTSLSRLLSFSPAFVSDIEKAGGAVVAFYSLGSSPDDLTPIAKLYNEGFRPSATVLLLNEHALSYGKVRSESFTAVQSHTFFRELVDNQNAVPLLIPRLKVADQIEQRRLNFSDAAAETLSSPLTLSERYLLRNWIRQMKEAYKPISAWFELVA